MMSLSDSNAILRKLSKTTMKKPVVAKPVADLLNACHKGVIDALRELKETNPDAFFRLREEANAKPVRTLPTRPKKVAESDKYRGYVFEKGTMSRNTKCSCDQWMYNDGKGGYYCDCGDAPLEEDLTDDESDDEDEWMEVYSYHHGFGAFCGEHEHLQPYRDFRYYQCWGGGPEGGYIECGEELYRVNRTWLEPFTVERVNGRVEEKGDQIRIIKQ